MAYLGGSGACRFRLKAIPQSGDITFWPDTLGWRIPWPETGATGEAAHNCKVDLQVKPVLLGESTVIDDQFSIAGTGGLSTREYRIIYDHIEGVDIAHLYLWISRSLEEPLLVTNRATWLADTSVWYTSERFLEICLHEDNVNWMEVVCISKDFLERYAGISSGHYSNVEIVFRDRDTYNIGDYGRWAVDPPPVPGIDGGVAQ